MRAINRILAVAAAVSLAGITGCAAQGQDPSPPPAAGSSSVPSSNASAHGVEAVITIRDFAFDVPTSVKPGATVTVTNADSAPHTLTAREQGGFDIAVPAGGTVIFQAPDAPGEYALICSFHPKMSGTLVVE